MKLRYVSTCFWIFPTLVLPKLAFCLNLHNIYLPHQPSSKIINHRKLIYYNTLLAVLSETRQIKERWRNTGTTNAVTSWNRLTSMATPSNTQPEENSAELVVPSINMVLLLGFHPPPVHPNTADPAAQAARYVSGLVKESESPQFLTFYSYKHETS